MADKMKWTCVVCRQQVPNLRKKSIFAVGPCEHVICYECSTRMRVLCKQNECPICRQQMPKVIIIILKNLFNQPYYFVNTIFQVVFTISRDKKFESFHPEKCIHSNTEFGIYFEDEACLDAYGRLLEHPCLKCKSRPAFKSMHDLQTHLRKEHELFMCELCVANLKIFTDERKYYTRKELSRHRRSGDPDETCHRGHPLCEFCDDRFLDEDELQGHMRREHYYCHFCDPAGVSHFFGDYQHLREHFQKHHFLCKECDSKEEKFTCAFNSEIDLQAHITQFHSQNMSKLDLKKARTLSLDFFVTSRAGTSNPNFNPGKNNKKKQPIEEEIEEEPVKEPEVPVPKPEDFPDLYSDGKLKDNSNASKESNESQNSFSAHVNKNPSLASNKDEDFPALVSTNKIKQAKGLVGVPVTNHSRLQLAEAVKNKPSKNGQTKKSSDFGWQVKVVPKKNGKQKNSKNSTILTQEDFPNLCSNSILNNSHNSNNGNNSKNNFSNSVNKNGASKSEPKINDNKSANENKEIVNNNSSKPLVESESEFPALPIKQKKNRRDNKLNSVKPSSSNSVVSLEDCSALLWSKACKN